MMFLSLFLSSCQKTKYQWQPGISAPKYYPVAGNISFENAGHGSNTSFANGWGNEYGGVVSGEKYKEIPKEVFINYYSVVDGKDFRGKVLLDQKKILNLFRKYNINDDKFAHLVVGMAPGGWIRVWFTTVDEQIEVAKAKLKGYINNDIGVGLKTKNFKTWGSTYTYWKHHGIPYEAWANNEKEYDIIFDFDKPNHRKVNFGYVSKDGTIYEAPAEKSHQKLPVEIEICWLSKAKESYCCKIPMPKSFQKVVEQNKLKEVYITLKIENDDEHAVLYLISNNENIKLVRFKSKKPTTEEKKEIDYGYASEVEYFIP